MFFAQCFPKKSHSSIISHHWCIYSNKSLQCIVFIDFGLLSLKCEKSPNWLRFSPNINKYKQNTVDSDKVHFLKPIYVLYVCEQFCLRHITHHSQFNQFAYRHYKYPLSSFHTDTYTHLLFAKHIHVYGLIWNGTFMWQWVDEYKTSNQTKQIFNDK